MTVLQEILSRLKDCQKEGLNSWDIPSPIAERDDLEILRTKKEETAVEAAKGFLKSIQTYMGADAISLTVAEFITVLHVQKFAHWLLALCEVGASPEEALEDFQQFFGRRKLTGKLISILGYANIDQAVRLGNAISIIPAQELRPSIQRMGGLWSPLNSFPYGHSTIPCVIKPVNLPFSKVILPEQRRRELYRGARLGKQDKKRVRRQNTVSEAFKKEYALLEEVRNVLTVCGPGALIQQGFWVEWDKHSSPLWFFQEPPKLYRHEFRYNGRSDFQLNGEQINVLLSKYFKLPTTEREGLRIPLVRLNQALRRNEIADRAIDLGIALESLLISGKDDSGVHGEVTYRLSHRGAVFGEEDAKKRKKVFHLLKAVYNLRSEAIHSGKVLTNKEVKSGGFNWKPENALSEGEALCARILTKCVMSGGRPEDWNILSLGLPEEP